jgi:glycogen debranching enzyme
VELKHGNAFLSARDDGSISPQAPGEGFFLDDCRHLSRHELRGAPAGVSRRYASEVELHETLELDGPAELLLDADFEPMLALRGFARLERPPTRAESRPQGIRFERTGLDGVNRSTTVTFDPPGPRWDAAGRVQVRYLFDPGRPPAPDPAPPHPIAIHTFDRDLQRVVDQALADLAMLRSTWDGRPYVAAGIPWYATLFGRDSLITAMQMLALDPALAAGTLRTLAAHVGRTHDPAREEEPGKVPHELRTGELAAVDVTPLARYYGSVDATPLFLWLLELTADHGLADELAEPAAAMREWVASRDPLTHDAPGPGGLRNQGWKDSPQAIIDGTGRPLEHPIALVEAQGYATRVLGGGQEKLEAFWLPGQGHYAMALDGDGRATPVLASNQGHLLWAGVLGADRARAVRDALMGPRSFSGWGIRTLAEGEPTYDPDSYHCGSVWPHDTAVIAAGLLAYGFEEDFLTLLDALVDVALAAPDGRLPELFSGRPRVAGRGPGWIPVSCRPQAWAAGALPYLLGLGHEKGVLPSRATRLDIEC